MKKSCLIETSFPAGFARAGTHPATCRAWLWAAVLVALNLLPAGRVTAQTFTTLHSFTALASGINSDGANPYAGLIVNSSGNTLYGTASAGGSSGQGTVFAINSDGTGFTNLYNFAAAGTNSSGIYTNSDGAGPSAGLISSGNTLYGTAASGGSSGNGTVFALNADGTGFTNLHSFTAAADKGNGFYTNSDGAYPSAELILSGNTLYGTAPGGGSSGVGTVFAVNTDGTRFTNLHSFTYSSDGAGPYAGLIRSGKTLYGTAQQGGTWYDGTLFAVNTDGAGFTNLHSFAGGDGAIPNGGLILSGNTLYGTAAGGGSSGKGSVFAVHTDGTGFTNLHSFTTFSINASGVYTNSDGANPYAGLILTNNTLYGTAQQGGSSGVGTVFALNTDGTGFTTLHSFTGPQNYPSPVTNSDGAVPSGGLILSGNTLYGTAGGGGSSGNGTVFSLSFRPQLTITPSGTNVILSWPANVAGFDYTGYTLQSAPALTGTFTNLPAATNPSTNPIAGPQQFFRLSQ